MTLNRLSVLAFALSLGTTGLVTARAYGVPAGSPLNGYGQDQAGWDVPPPNFTQTQANGFRDGIVAGQDDIAHRIQPNATARPEYRNPPQMPFLQRVMYRDGFQKGYQRAMDRFYGAPVPPPQPVPVAPPPPMASHGDRMAFRNRGFQEGMDGALRDLDNHRRPDPNNRDEFRRPNVPNEMVEAYKDGFRHGYERGMAALTEGFGRQTGPGGEFRIRGFHDGAEGAIRDWDNNRRPDPNNRDEFRRPNNVPPNMVEVYRDGFRRGYQHVADEMQGYIGRR
jgi:hypothetical protein